MGRGFLVRCGSRVLRDGVAKKSDLVGFFGFWELGERGAGARFLSVQFSFESRRKLGAPKPSFLKVAVARVLLLHPCFAQMLRVCQLPP
jgi:hypothetical protein